MSDDPDLELWPNMAGGCWKWLVGAALLLVAGFVALMLSGCSPDAAFVKAMRNVHDSVAPEWIAYVDSDDTLHVRQQEQRRRLVRAWGAALTAAEEGSE